MAEYCGVQILTFAILSNHFHVLVRVPKVEPIPDRELWRRYAVLDPKPTKYQVGRLEVIEAQLRSGDLAGVAWRNRQLALMGDLSPFMKLVKQRFSTWFNRSYGRYGTLWSERFKSVLVEAKSGVLRTIAAYIDLNAVRAGLVSDPKDYRFCGYGEAVAGQVKAQRGLGVVAARRDWNEVQAWYREILFGRGAQAKPGRAALPRVAFDEIVAKRGKLPLSSVLLCRVRYFSDGAVLGSRAFVQTHLATYQKLTGLRSRTSPREIPKVADGGDLMTLRGLRRQSFGRG